MQITEVLICLGICVILPVLIVWLVLRSRKHEVDRKTEVLLKAMEVGIPIDESLLKTSKKPKSTKKDLLDKLTGACITTLMGAAFFVLSFFNSTGVFADFDGMAFPGIILLAVGIALFISYFFGKKMLAKEIEVEEKALAENSEKE